MKNYSLRLSLATSAAVFLALAGCSKKAEPVPAPPPTPAATNPAPADPLKAATDAAQAKIAAAENDVRQLEAKAAATAKADAAKLQALADEKAAEAKKLASDLKTKASAGSTELLNKANALSANTSAVTTTDADATKSLTTLAKNLTPANFSTWYEQASKESSGIISSLATKASELGNSASPEFKSLYESALLQKKNFEDVSAKLKTGGLLQWAEYYPALQSSWADLSKSLVTAKSLLAQYSK